MKKALVTTLTAILMLATGNAGGTVAKACDIPQCRNLFTTTLNKLLEDNNITEADVSYVTEKVYDMEFNELGCLYDFTVDETSGFALMIYYEGRFEISEIYLDAENPYENCNGIKVYPATSLYLYFENGNYYDALTDLPYTDEAVASISDMAFRGGDEDIESASQRIYYTYHNVVEDWLCANHPNYTGVSGINNICVAIAAGNIIGYWDRFNPNLIADFEPGELWNGMYFYDPAGAEVDDSIRQLAADMGAGNGTTVAECKSGMTTYCKRAGYSISYGNLMSWGSFNYTAAKKKFAAGEPIMIFSQGFTVYMFMPSEENNYDSYMGITCRGNHAMAGFGYMEVSYTFSDGSTDSAEYIRVASGQGILKEGYYNIKTHKINDAFSVKIS